MKYAVEVKNLGKKYTLGQKERYLTLRDMVVKAAKVPGNLLKGKKFSKKGEFWALKEVNFNVEEGDAIGIIGRNGAGKSTLLKILSRITEPTEGEVRLNGRVSSLLEVGTGFHPELTGRENIYLNGAILGMRKREIEAKFNEIVEFSGVEKFLDTPVKKYSSGMQVRLAFSVAAHLEPDILVIDEVLAVGDAEFQKKCLGKMDEVTKTAGRTILFVSHDMGAIQRLCKKTIMLEDGKIAMIGETAKVVDYYISRINQEAEYKYEPSLYDDISIIKVTIFDNKKEKISIVDYDKPFSIEVEYQVNKEVSGMQMALICDSAFGGRLFSTASSEDELYLEDEKGIYKIRYDFPQPSNIYINPGLYWIRFSIGAPTSKPMSSVSDIALTVKSSEENPRYIHSSKNINCNIIDGKWVK
ncbi:MAG: ABC transporter related protein [candidate division WS6 bacterium GW2011_GWC1_36_11]|uniref:ABC transporter related protein n=1 Tax=candidate division WS6 bacterium GW2011_GWC1_36_11 TaxID=1619090 RepID=A0A0G0DF75_9BACT|nr:MAG: ABC transporter related protein [candidate division WS6 bacterium GW2011_GWC1_36_11]